MLASKSCTATALMVAEGPSITADPVPIKFKLPKVSPLLIPPSLPILIAPSPEADIISSLLGSSNNKNSLPLKRKVEPPSDE